MKLTILFTLLTLLFTSILFAQNPLAVNSSESNEVSSGLPENSATLSEVTEPGEYVNSPRGVVLRQDPESGVKSHSQNSIDLYFKP